MQESLEFRGLVGEIVRTFVRLRTLLSALPVIIATAVLAALGGWLASKMSLAWPFQVLMLLIVGSPIYGRFGIAGLRGDFECGFFGDWKGVGGFVVRYAALSLAWGTVLGGLALLLAKSGVGFSSGFDVSFKGLLAIVIWIAWMLAPTASLIICLSSSSVGEVFQKERWWWLLIQRRGDFPAFISSLIGGMILFFMITVPFLMLISAGLIALSDKFAFVATFIFLPFAAAPILIGRLAGGFVFAESRSLGNRSGEPRAVEPTPTTSPATPSSAGVQPVTPARHRKATAGDGPLAIQQEINECVTLAESDLESAIAKAETLQKQHPNHGGLLAELSKFYLKAGREDEALTLASEVIIRSMDGGANPVAISTYSAFILMRDRLALNGADWQRLARVLLNRGKLHDAAWCFVQSGQTGAEPIQVQKGIIAVAAAADKANDAKTAIAFYEYFLKKFPDSSFCDHVQNALEQLRQRSS